MDIFGTLLDDVQFRLSLMTPLDMVDLALVTLAYFGLLQLVRRSKAAFLLRGVMVAVFVLLATNLLLPLPTFDWVLLVLMGGLVVATPIALQSELQRFLERLGRNRFRRSGSADNAEQIATPIRRAMARMADEKTGALLAIEGKDSLAAVIATGVPVDAQLTDELLRTLYWDKTPLHDGAVIVRDGRVVAAGCVLPLTDQELISARRLGTRHRAAVGLSEVSDALVLVVSEETGRMARAREGNLKTGLDEAGVQEAIVEFFTSDSSNSAENSFSPTDVLRSLSAASLYLLLAFFFALLTWAVVMNRNNPIELVEFNNVSLRINDLPTDTLLQSTPPETITVQVRTTADTLADIGSDSFLATASLADSGDGLQRVDIAVTNNVENAQLVGWTPRALDVELVAIETRSIPIQIEVTDEDQLPIGYDAGTVIVEVDSAEISGAAPLVERVTWLHGELSIANATANINRRVTLAAIDESGSVVEGVTLLLPQVPVRMGIRQRFATATVGVRVATSGVPPENYSVSSTASTPAVITLRGETDEMAEFDSFVSTTEIDISELRGYFTATVPLELPDGLTALGADGSPIQTVNIVIDVKPLPGVISLEKAIIPPPFADLAPVTIEPDVMRLTISGPLPLLNSIQADPDLISLRINVTNVPPNVPTEVPLEIFAPAGVVVETNGIETVVVLIEVPEEVDVEEPVDSEP